MRIHIGKDGTQSGPFTREQVQAMLATGELRGDELAWTDGQADWVPLSTLVPVTRASADPAPYNPYAPPVIGGVPLTSIHQPGTGPSGIGGWLLFYCIALTILSPLLSLAQAVGTVGVWEKVPALRNALLVETGGVLLLVACGVVVGILLWMRHPHALKIVKAFLIVRLCSFIVIEVVALLLMQDLGPKVFEAGIGGGVGATIREVAYFLIWWFYFKKSVRVANTFPSA
ncbi:DUF2569 family protein [Luteolibacter ambystomatis]|uniref:DUF2569 family protein n=1 Tax=Luteolibacter ambystomatis TaxID=2824561 RepID=A0A975G6Z8_9BACT|nr:GYF domain-containing protein [Luteolibacter ambystomatis]QUE49435.1 DUF2569 family protein [Luteolibacter ambystomatis]